MRILRICTALLFVLVLAGYLLTGVIALRTEDRERPVITSSVERIHLSVNDGEEKLFEGLTATDTRDGDLTGEIMIGNRSKFSETGVVEITYLVFDRSNNCTSFVREAEYTDYTSPVFGIKEPLVFEVGENISILKKLSLTDSIDGDISNKIKIVTSNINTVKPGAYTIGLEATNSYGETVTLQLPVNIVERKNPDIKINLTEHIVHIKRGGSFSARSYIKDVTLPGSKASDDVQNVGVDSNVNTDIAGTYYVLYSYKDSVGFTGYANLAVIVEE